MLRSVVSAMAANMMLVQCGNSDVPISLACSTEAGDSPDHDIIGTASRLGPRRSAVRQTSTTWFCYKRSGRFGDQRDYGEFRTIPPHPVQDCADAPCQSHHRALCTSAFGNLCSPASQPCRATPMYHDGSRLAQGSSQIGVASSRNAADHIALPGLVARWCKANPWTNFLGR